MTFAHTSERQFARLLDFYDIRWEFEPREFAVEWDADGEPTKFCRPDFYLPDEDQYIEITTRNAVFTPGLMTSPAIWPMEPPR